MFRAIPCSSSGGHRALRGRNKQFHTPPPPLHHHTSQVIPKLACLPNIPRQTHSRIYIYTHPRSIWTIFTYIYRVVCNRTW